MHIRSQASCLKGAQTNAGLSNTHVCCSMQHCLRCDPHEGALSTTELAKVLPSWYYMSRAYWLQKLELSHFLPDMYDPEGLDADCTAMLPAKTAWSLLHSVHAAGSKAS